MIKVKISTQLMGHFVKLGMNRADIGIWNIPYRVMESFKEGNVYHDSRPGFKHVELGKVVWT